MQVLGLRRKLGFKLETNSDSKKYLNIKYFILNLTEGAGQSKALMLGLARLMQSTSDYLEPPIMSIVERKL